MGRNSTVTENDITKAIEQLLEDGRETTFRNVHSITGGGTSQVLKLFQKVMDDHARESLCLAIISPAVLSVIKQEVQDNVRRHSAASEKTIEDYRKHQQELHEIIKKQDTELDHKETETGGLRQKLANTEAQAAEEKLQAGKKLGARDEKLRVLEEDLGRSLQELDNLRMEVARLQYLDGAMAELKEELENVRQAHREAEIKAAKAEARIDEQSKPTGRSGSKRRPKQEAEQE